MSGFVRMRHAEHGGEADIPAEAAEAMQAKGWEPLGEPRSWTEAQDEPTLAAQRQAAEREAAKAELEDTAEDSIKKVLGKVGDDPVLALAALEAESRRPKQRPSLVSKLETIAARAGQASEEEVNRA